MPHPADFARRPWQGHRVLLGVSGGVAAYKSVQAARDLALLGARVDVVLTSGARRFVKPLAFEAVTGRPALTDLFSAEGSALHVDLGRRTDAVCIAPATADLLARLAVGRADDLLTTSLLVARCPVIVCPAMNPRMFDNPLVRDNLDRLRSLPGFEIVGPRQGPLAVGEGEGLGRMAEPNEMVDWVGRVLSKDGPLTAKRVLVTAGPTRESIDPVRYIGNRSSGRMGYALARAAWLRGAEVDLVSGPTSLPRPVGVEREPVETAVEMHDAVLGRVGESDVNLFVAAVADLRPDQPSARKIKREVLGPDGLTLDLVPNPDIAGAANRAGKPGSLSVGFALESEDLIANAGRKLDDGRFDLVVANPAGEADAGFGSSTNRVTILAPGREPEPLPLMDKADVAEAVLDRVESLLGERT